MKILVIGFEPARSDAPHQVRVVTETIREIVKNHNAGSPVDEVNIIPFIPDGGLSVITLILAKAQIEVLNPDAVLFITDKSKEGYQVSRLSSKKDEEFIFDEEGNSIKRKTLPVWMMKSIKGDSHCRKSQNIDIHYGDVEKKFQYLNQLRCYCNNAIGWIRLPPPCKFTEGNNDTQIVDSIKVVLAGLNGMVSYLNETIELAHYKRELCRNNSTYDDMLTGAAEGDLAMFCVRNKITEFNPRPFKYDPIEFESYFDKLIQATIDAVTETEKEAEEKEETEAVVEVEKEVEEKEETEAIVEAEEEVAEKEETEAVVEAEEGVAEKEETEAVVEAEKEFEEKGETEEVNPEEVKEVEEVKPEQGEAGKEGEEETLEPEIEEEKLKQLEAVKSEVDEVKAEENEAMKPGHEELIKPEHDESIKPEQEESIEPQNGEMTKLDRDEATKLEENKPREVEQDEKALANAAGTAVDISQSPTIKAITRLQSHARKIRVQRTLGRGSDKTDEHLIAFRKRRKEKAVTKIQKNWRGYMTRCDLKMKHEAALLLQSKLSPRSVSRIESDGPTDANKNEHEYDSGSEYTEETLSSDEYTDSSDEGKDEKDRALVDAETKPLIRQSSVDIDDIDIKIGRLEAIKAKAATQQASGRQPSIDVGDIDEKIRSLLAIKSIAIMGRAPSGEFEDIEETKNRLKRASQVAKNKVVKRQISCELGPISARLKFFEKANSGNKGVNSTDRKFVGPRRGRRPRGGKKPIVTKGSQQNRLKNALRGGGEVH